MEATYTIAVMDLKVRYESSRLGFVWSVIKPAFQFVVYYIIFTKILKQEHEQYYALRLFLGVVLWNFFAEATSNGATSLVSKKGLITKVMVPTQMAPIGAYATSLLSLAINLVVFGVFYIIGVKNPWTNIVSPDMLYTLYAFVVLSVLVVALNLILSVTNSYIRDIQQIWDLVLNYGVFLTPIIYKLPIPTRFLGAFYTGNALAIPIELFRRGLFPGITSDFIPLQFIAVNLCVCIGLLFAGIYLHARLGRRVMDHL
jgi:ABC-type polysaccharide/polyol phosphate export permease